MATPEHFRAFTDQFFAGDKIKKPERAEAFKSFFFDESEALNTNGINYFALVAAALCKFTFDAKKRMPTYGEVCGYYAATSDARKLERRRVDRLLN